MITTGQLLLMIIGVIVFISVSTGSIIYYLLHRVKLFQKQTTKLNLTDMEFINFITRLNALDLESKVYASTQLFGDCRIYLHADRQGVVSFEGVAVAEGFGEEINNSMIG